MTCGSGFGVVWLMGVASRNDGSDFRVTLRRCGRWVWPYLPISHDAVMYLYLHIHKNQQQLLQE